jgi:hypothetical protein
MFRASSTTMSTSSDASVCIHEIERVMKVRGGIDITGFEEMLSLRHLFCFTTKQSRERLHRRKRVPPPPYLRSGKPVLTCMRSVCQMLSPSCSYSTSKTFPSPPARKMRPFNVPTICSLHPVETQQPPANPP